MSAYYNENDPYAAQWLRNLIDAGLIAPGVVDERSIVDVRPSDLRGFAQCHFFAGIGVWSYALRRAGWADSRPVWTGSCPCQPHSAAAADRRKGFADERDLWPIWFRLIEAGRPDVVLGEQVDDTAAWIDRTATDMESAGFAFGAVDFPACAVDAPNERMRTYFVAYADCPGRGEQGRPISMEAPHMAVERSGRRSFFGDFRTAGELGRIRRVEPGIRLLAHGSATRVGRLRAYGNAINAEQAKAFIGACLDLTPANDNEPRGTTHAAA
ncbi:DNA cytosine methyltransferase [Kaustia mangrovi]|uniref:DNA cytosine methyltransferase n=1 Tax=Kaustia mangrovi TaxID=2593653 RepID=UPI001BCBC620|nr:DNA cytosine methyltransferase [Kaustia mangrovi]